MRNGSEARGTLHPTNLENNADLVSPYHLFLYKIPCIAAHR